MANLLRADLSETNLGKANLSMANLMQTNLQGAYLRAAICYQSALQGANLAGVVLTNALLINANLQHVQASAQDFLDVEPAALQGVIIDPATARRLGLIVLSAEQTMDSAS
jgi:uncharacterized protein YjbI with pentapeptide repeats